MSGARRWKPRCSYMAGLAYMWDSGDICTRRAHASQFNKRTKNEPMSIPTQMGQDDFMLWGIHMVSPELNNAESIFCLEIRCATPHLCFDDRIPIPSRDWISQNVSMPHTLAHAPPSCGPCTTKLRAAMWGIFSSPALVPHQVGLGHSDLRPTCEAIGPQTAAECCYTTCSVGGV